LLGLYPTSSVAYAVKARAAEVQGEAQRAVAAYERARALLTQADDRLWLAHAPRDKVNSTLQLLTERIQSVGKKGTIIDKH
jgi:hypothetical protein